MTRAFGLRASDFRVENEDTYLVASLAALAIGLLVLIGLSLGTVLIVLAIVVAVLKVRQGQLVGQSVKVSQSQFPDIHQAAIEVASRLEMEMPDVFILQDPVINAYALGFFGRKSVVLNSATVEALSAAEIRSILGHEFAHVKCEHTNWMVFTSLKDALRIPIISDIVGFIFLAWSRKAEYTADRGAVIASRDLVACVSALGKVAVGQRLFSQLNLDAFFDQRDEVTRDDLSRISEHLAGHPYLVNRIHKLREFYDSTIYRKIVESQA
jgi:Zn-dependent protease with chaperone function